jgi:cell division protein ZapE
VPLVPRRLADLPSPANLDLDTLVPPPRFGTVTFSSFEPLHPSQADAKRRIEEAAAAATDERTAPGWSPPWGRRRARQPGRGLYLDGGFGVGKTHLLAAAYHAAPTRSKRYLSFQDLVYLIGVMGMVEARTRLGGARLYCLDEFELDDPGNTLIVKTFLAHVFAGGALVITTSNTPPEAQGAGRFNADDFRREIQSIAERFDVVSVSGPDWRQASATGRLMPREELPEAGDGVVHAQWSELLTHLARHHPSRYRAQLRAAGGVAVWGVQPLGDQHDALRFVHFVDKAYDLRVPLWLAGALRLEELFDPSYADGAYAAKYHRATSRLAEILAEARVAGAELRVARA